MSAAMSPPSWSELDLGHLFYAYKKAKADCYFERTILAAQRFAEYEQNLYGNLVELHRRLKHGEIATLLAESLGQPAVVAKKLARSPRCQRANDGHDFFSDPSRFFVRLKATHTLMPEFRLVGDFPVQMHVLSALWVNCVGEKFDSRLSAHAYGSRLRRYRPNSEDSAAKTGPYHVEALGSFEPYFTPYKAWRANGLSSIRSELESERAVVAISFDLSSYYHGIDPMFIALEGFQSAIGVELSDWEQGFTRVVAEALSSWAVMANRSLRRFGVRAGKGQTGGLPIGLSAARVMANVLLYELDDAILKGLTPVYYGRYVDDLFLVIHDPGTLACASALLEWIQQRVPLFTITPDGACKLSFGKLYAGNSRVTLQPSKQKVFFLAGAVGLDLLSNIEAEIREVSSERRLLPDPDSLEQMASAKVLCAAENAAEEADTLRRANGLSIRRLGWSILLRCVETLAQDLHAKDWLKERSRFYSFARAHVLRPDRILDHADYLPRLLSLAVSLEEWSEALQLWRAYLTSVADLRGAAGDSDDNYCKLNGLKASPTSKADLWNHFIPHLTAICADAVLRSLSWSTIQSSESLSSITQELLRDLGLPSDVAEVRRLALILRESDWAKTAYKEHIRRDAITPRQPLLNEEKLVQLYPRASDLINFLKASADPVPDGTSAPRTLFKTNVPLSLQSAESLFPYLFPTRPYAAEEIALFVPKCIRSADAARGKLFGKYVRALRGSWVTERNLGILDGSAVEEGGFEQGPIISIGSRDGVARVTLGITSLLTDEKSWRQAAENDPDLSPARYKRLGQLIKQAVQTHPKPTHLLLPELSLPLRWLPSISARLRDARICLIAGLEYHHHADGVSLHSDAVLVLSDDRLGYPAWVELRQPKTLPAPAEERTLLHEFGRAWASVSNQKPVYLHHGFAFGLLVCSELQNMKYRQQFQARVDSLFVLSWNQDLDTFASLVESAALDVHAYIALVNNRGFGDSRVRSPAKKSYLRDLCRLKGGENDYLVVVVLEVHTLRAFQSRAKRWPNDEDNFKPVPEGFRIHPLRHVVPE